MRNTIYISREPKEDLKEEHLKSLNHDPIKSYQLGAVITLILHLRQMEDS